MTALDKLIEAVEAGELSAVNAELSRMFAADHSIPWDTISNANSAFRGSLDAALALHEALLPGWRWDLDAACNAGVWNSCDLLPAITGEANTPARAWLLAILRAYRSVQA